MIRVTVELVPGGVGTPERLGRIEISNDIFTSLESAGRRGDYDAVIYKKQGRPFKRVKVKNYPRLSYHVWELVFRILEKAREQNGGKL